MSTAIFQQISQGMAQLNDGLRGAFDRDGVRCFLLKKEGQTQRYVVVQELTSGYYVRFSEYRQQMQFRIANDDSGITDAIAQSSAIGYGVPNGDGKIDIYPVSPELRDRVPPNGSSPFWKLYGDRKAEIRFTIV
jgi:hypothetical protein